MPEPIHCLVFSKDRAMQLDAFLRSAERYAPYAHIDILWYGTAGDHADSYESAWQPLRFVQEHGGTDFEDMFRLWLADRQPKRVVFHTDDEVFYRPFPSELLDVDDAVICTHLGRNTTYCHTHDAAQAIPASFPRWRWRDAEHDFAYPLSLNGCVLRSEWLLPLLDFNFSNPTQLEAGIAYRAGPDYFHVEEMVAGERSCTVALPHNRVSVDSGCAAGSNPEWQPDALCARYLDGWRIDLDAMDFSDVRAAHQEIALEFYRP